MSAFQILIAELAKHGQTTYAALCRRHKGYDKEHFEAAVHKAKRLGLATKERGRGTPIVACGDCPCCGRKL